MASCADWSKSRSSEGATIMTAESEPLFRTTTEISTVSSALGAAAGGTTQFFWMSSTTFLAHDDRS